MMDFILIPATIGVCIYGFYKVIELFVRRKERMMMIEKLTEIKSQGEIVLPDFSDWGEGVGRFIALRAGLLLMGLGLGLLIGYIIVAYTLTPGVVNDMTGVVYGASTLLFGGVGLVSAFIVEWKMRRK